MEEDQGAFQEDIPAGPGRPISSFEFVVTGMKGTSGTPYASLRSHALRTPLRHASRMLRLWRLCHVPLVPCVLHLDTIALAEDPDLTILSLRNNV